MKTAVHKIKAAVKSIRDRLAIPILCSACFSDRGLCIEAEKVGTKNNRKCPNCGARSGVKLNKDQLYTLHTEFFWSGSYVRTWFGGSSMLVSNPHRYGERGVRFPSWLVDDAHLIEDALKIGIFLYGPPLWRLGEIDHLRDLQNTKVRKSTIDLILATYPERILKNDTSFYRIRVNLSEDEESVHSQYDAPPKKARCKLGRLDSKNLACLYGSEDLEVCIHECRVTQIDTCFVATIRPNHALRMLDLTAEPQEPFQTPFESLNLAIHYLFAAESHSYQILRAIARAAKKSGYDGILYPSYFRAVKAGHSSNLAIFGYPIRNKQVEIECINRAILKKAQYELTMGPLFG